MKFIIPQVRAASCTAIHTFLVLVLVWLAYALSLPAETFSINHGWSQFARLGTENEWTFRFAVAAGIGVAGLFSSNRSIQVASAFILATAHMTVAFCFYLSIQQTGVVNTGTGTYALIALLGYVLVPLRWFS